MVIVGGDFGLPIGHFRLQVEALPFQPSQPNLLRRSRLGSRLNI